MAKASVQDILALKNEVIQVVLEMTERQDWSDISMHDIANKIDIHADDLIALFPDKNDIIGAYARQIDSRLEMEFQGQGDSDSQHDKLFDVFMERFDILNENKSSIISIMNSITLDPKQGIQALPFLCQSVSKMADLSGVEINGWKGALMIAGLSGVYIKTLRDWVNDKSDDMAATMASLDKNLGYLEKINF